MRRAWPVSLVQKMDINISQREHDCLSLLVLGYSAREIAQHLGLSRRTVEHYIESLKSKLGCLKKSEIVTRSIELNLIEIVVHTLR